jgi:heme exporter protein D
MSQFFQMGGYAAYVWPAYAVTLAAIVLNVVWARRALARSREEARRRLPGASGRALPARRHGDAG